MIPDLTNPYLSNGSLSPSARTVSVAVDICAALFPLFSLFYRTLQKKKEQKKKKKLWPCVKVPCVLPDRHIPLRVASQGVLTTSLFFLGI